MRIRPLLVSISALTLLALLNVQASSQDGSSPNGGCVLSEKLCSIIRGWNAGSAYPLPADNTRFAIQHDAIDTPSGAPNTPGTDALNAPGTGFGILGLVGTTSGGSSGSSNGDDEGDDDDRGTAASSGTSSGTPAAPASARAHPAAPPAARSSSGASGGSSGASSGGVPNDDGGYDEPSSDSRDEDDDEPEDGSPS